MNNRKGRAWIELNRENLLHNAGEFRRITGPSCILMPAVKANAYGHGMIQTAEILKEAGIQDFCVASAEEGILLRKSGMKGEILVLGYTYPEMFPELEKYHLTQTVVDESYAKVLSEYGKNLAVHVAVDTGMHRLGIPSADIERIAGLWSLPGISITGIFSHLCVSDGVTEEDIRYTEEQISRFRSVERILREKGICGFRTHIQGSYGILNYPEEKFDCARPGIALYGVLSTSEDHVKAETELRPVLSLKARVECIKTLESGEGAGYGLTYTAASRRKIAIVSIGYADGIPRSLSNRGAALLRGRKVPVIGRICMDQLTLDVTDVPYAVPGDEAVFIGRSGSLQLTAEDMAAQAGTISNEILSRLGERPDRIIV